MSFPHQVEAFPLYFEDPFSIYRLDWESNTGRLRVIKLRQDKSESEFEMLCKRTRLQL